jgi:hypothetical protein
VSKSEPKSLKSYTFDFFDGKLDAEQRIFKVISFPVHKILDTQCTIFAARRHHSSFVTQEKFLAVLGDYDSIGMDHAGSIKVDCPLFPFF